MNIHEIDMNNYSRKSHFEYFKELGYPYVGATVNIDISKMMKYIKLNQKPFFLTFLYYVVKAANQVPELRQRIRNNGIIEYQMCEASHTVAKTDGTFCYCVTSSELSYDAFIEDALIRQNQAKEQGTIDDGDNPDSRFFISSVPWFTFTSLIQPVPFPADSNPRITWGKYFTQDQNTLIPVSLLCHHALVDGVHMGRFFQGLQILLDQQE